MSAVSTPTEHNGFWLDETRDCLRQALPAGSQLIVFGSRARGDAQADSDIDLLVELEEPTFDHYMDLKFFLEEHLHRSVDLVLEDTVKPRLKPILAREVAYA